MGFLGHVLRERGWEKRCLLDMVEGRRARGRERKKYMDGIKQLMGCERFSEVLRLAEDRSTWCCIVANINSDTALQ